MIITCGIFLYSTLLKKILLCHPTNARWNTWSIPKGIMEKGEAPLNVGIRELKEETGIDLADINVLSSQQLPSRKYTKQAKVLESFLVVTDTDLSAHIYRSNLVEGKNFSEIDQWKWFTLAQAEDLVHESQRANLEDIAKILH